MLLRTAIMFFAFTVAATSVSSQELSSLPEYKPEQKVFGPIRSVGGTMGGQYKIWEEGFRKFHPDVRFVDNLISSEASIGGLYTLAADLGPSGHDAELMDLLPFTENFGYYPTEIVAATGAFDPGKKGGSGSLVIFVNKDNPIAKLTMKQLDGIFGAERTGGLKGIVLTPEFARGADENIRTWGQLGLSGDWADKPIQTYGYTFTGMKWFFQMKVFHGGQKWNPNYREYVETESFMVDRKNPEGRTLTIDQMLADLSKDKYGIAYCPLHYAKTFPQVKPLAIADKEGGPYYEPNRDNFQKRTYPLTRSAFIYLNHAPGHAVDPKVKEFLRYILSRDGQQEVVKYGRYLPLPAEVAREQLKKLE
jgi:phosphate transport system substrate-binding protein